MRDFTLSGGATLRSARLAYKTYGTLSDNRDNAIVYPTWYSGRHWENEWLIGDGMALDPARYFIIVPNMLGNGLSSSPSNTPPPYDGRASPTSRPGQRARAAQARDRALRDRAARRRDRLVDGRRADLPVGGQLSGDGPAHPARSAARRRRARTTSSSSRASSGAHRRRAWKDGWYDEQPDHADCAPPRASTPAGASRRPSTGRRSTRDGLHVARGLPRRLLGGLLPRRAATPTTCSRCCGPGSTATSARRPGFDGDARRRSARSRRERS
jgi:hypothetical protein